MNFNFKMLSSDENIQWYSRFSSLPLFWLRYDTVIWSGNPRYLKYISPRHKITNISDCTSFEEAILKNTIAGNEQAVRELKLLREFDEYIDSKRAQDEHIGKEQEKAI